MKEFIDKNPLLILFGVLMLSGLWGYFSQFYENEKVSNNQIQHENYHVMEEPEPPQEAEEEETEPATPEAEEETEPATPEPKIWTNPYTVNEYNKISPNNEDRKYLKNFIYIFKNGMPLSKNASISYDDFYKNYSITFRNQNGQLFDINVSSLFKVKTDTNLWRFIYNKERYIITSNKNGNVSNLLKEIMNNYGLKNQ